MNAAETKVKELSSNRFTSIIFLFRLAGIPVKMKEISTIYAAYMITVIICSSSTFIGTFADVNVHWDNLGRAMTSMRALFSFTNIMWIFSYCR
jgi:dTDP-4-amino-4,6-dideoxygalactose transaminase